MSVVPSPFGFLFKARRRQSKPNPWAGASVLAAAWGAFTWATWQERGSALPATPPPSAPTRPPDPMAPSESACADPLKLSFFGDVYVGARVDPKTTDVFSRLRPLLSWADENIVNLEGVITASSERAFPDLPFALKMPAHVPRLLLDDRIRYVTRANNHSMDYGAEGLAETTKALDAHGIVHAGAGANRSEALKPMVIAKKGMSVAVFSATTTYPIEAWANAQRPGVAFPWAKPFREAIIDAKKKHDFVVVAFHWGEELNPALRPHQPQYARLAIAHGADLVFGHHAHLAQAVEVVHGRLAAHGLGNMVFTTLSEGAGFALGLHAEFCKFPPSALPAQTPASTPAQAVTSPEPDAATRDALGSTSAASAAATPNPQSTALPDPPPPKGRITYAFTPLHTNNLITKYVTEPMDLAQFTKAIRPYVDKKLFPPTLRFHLPSVGKTRSLREWMDVLLSNSAANSTTKATATPSSPVVRTVPTTAATSPPPPPPPAKTATREPVQAQEGPR